MRKSSVIEESYTQNEDKQGSGRPVTVSTSKFQRQIQKALRLKSGASVRNVTSMVNRQGVKCSRQTVHNTAQSLLKLRWYKISKSQKLIAANKNQRVECAKRLRMKYGVRTGAKRRQWDRVVNTDFSGKFTPQPFRNRRNYGIWAEEGEVLLPSLLQAPTDKFNKRIIVWGAISSHGLIPPSAPINLTEWLRKQHPSNRRGVVTYMTGDLYAKLISEKAAPAIRRVFANTSSTPIFQDDQDSKQRTKTAMNAVETAFGERIYPEDGDAKYADVWPIERVWGAIKEKIRREQFQSELELEQRAAEEWRMFTVTKCQRMMEKIPNLLKQVIDQGGEQIYAH